VEQLKLAFANQFNFNFNSVWLVGCVVVKGIVNCTTVLTQSNFLYIDNVKVEEVKNPFNSLANAAEKFLY